MLMLVNGVLINGSDVFCLCFLQFQVGDINVSKEELSQNVLAVGSAVVANHNAIVAKNDYWIKKIDKLTKDNLALNRNLNYLRGKPPQPRSCQACLTEMAERKIYISRYIKASP